MRCFRFAGNKKNSSYLFVYSDGSKEDGEVIFYIIYLFKSLKYNHKTFQYNTIMKVRHKFEASFSGRYVLNEGNDIEN